MLLEFAKRLVTTLDVSWNLKIAFVRLSPFSYWQKLLEYIFNISCNIYWGSAYLHVSYDYKLMHPRSKFDSCSLVLRIKMLISIQFLLFGRSLKVSCYHNMWEHPLGTSLVVWQDTHIWLSKWAARPGNPAWFDPIFGPWPRWVRARHWTPSTFDTHNFC